MTGITGHIGLAPETTRGVPVAPTVFFPATEDISTDADRIFDEGPYGQRAYPNSVKGRGETSGSISDMKAYAGNIGHILRAFFGAPVTTTPTGATTGYRQHVFSPATAPVAADWALQSYTTQVRRGDTLTRYAGGQCGELSIGAEKDQMVSFDTSWLFKSETVVALGNPVVTLDTLKPFTYANVRHLRNGAAYNKIVDIGISMSNNLETEHLQDGTSGFGAVYLGGFSAEVSLKLAYTAQEFVNDYRLDAPFNMTFAWQIAAAPAEISLAIHFPRLVSQTPKNNLTGRTLLNLDATLVAEHDFTAGYACQVTLKNNVAVY